MDGICLGEEICWKPYIWYPNIEIGFENPLYKNLRFSMDFTQNRNRILQFQYEKAYAEGVSLNSMVKQLQKSLWRYA